MELTDFTTQQGRGQLQSLRRVLAQTVTQTRGNAAKVAWLDTVMDEVVVVVTADGNLNYSDLTQDKVSNLAVPSLLHKLIKATSESSSYGGDYKTQLLQDLADAIAALAA